MDFTFMDWTWDGITISSILVFRDTLWPLTLFGDVCRHAVVSARRGPTILMPRTVMRVEPNATIADLFEQASQSSAWTFASSVDDVVGVRLHSMAITHRVSDGHGRPVEHRITGNAYISGSGDGIRGNWIQTGWRFWAVTWHIYIDAAG